MGHDQLQPADRHCENSNAIDARMINLHGRRRPQRCRRPHISFAQTHAHLHIQRTVAKTCTRKRSGTVFERHEPQQKTKHAPPTLLDLSVAYINTRGAKLRADSHYDSCCMLPTKKGGTRLCCSSGALQLSPAQGDKRVKRGSAKGARPPEQRRALTNLSGCVPHHSSLQFGPKDRCGTFPLRFSPLRYSLVVCPFARR